MLRTIGLFTVFALFLRGSADYSCSMPGYTTMDNNTCYKVYPFLTDQPHDAAQCVTDGGFLASVPNAFTNAYIQTLAQQANVTEVWLGIECPNAKKSFCFNDDGTKFGPYSNFNPGQPNLGNALYMTVSNQQWSSDWTSHPRPFVCEVNYGTVPKRCPTYYQLYQDMCYRVINETRTRDDASADCKKVSGGFLATINSEVLNEWVTYNENLYAGKGDLHFGLVCPNVKVDGDTKSCLWDDGTTFNYSAFYRYFPEVKLEGGHNCAQFTEGQWFNYETCNKQLAYICQAPVLKN